MELRFDRWLNVENSGSSTIEIKDPSGVWHNIFADSLETATSWFEDVYDVTDRAAGNGVIHKNAAARKKSALQRLAAAIS